VAMTASVGIGSGKARLPVISFRMLWAYVAKADALARRSREARGMAHFIAGGGHPQLLGVR
jgi:hypothetical protein